MRTVWPIVAAAGLLVAGCGSAEGPAAPLAPSPASSGFSSPTQRIATARPLRMDLYGGRYPPRVDVALDRAGRGWAVWAHHNPPRVEAARFDGGWRAPITLHDATSPLEGVPGWDAYGAALAMNGGGEAIAGWSQNHAGFWIAMAKRFAGGAWEPATRVQETGSAPYGNRGRGLGIPGGPSVFLDEDGSAWMLWARTDPSSYPRQQPNALMASWRLPSGEWAPEQLVLDDAMFEAGADAASLPAGELLVAWASGGALHSARLSPSRRWEYGVVVDGNVARAVPALAPLPGGNTLVSWGRGFFRPEPYTDLSVSVVGRALDVDAPFPVAPIGTITPRVAFSASGAVFVAWTDDTGIWARRAPSIAEPFGPATRIAASPVAASDPNGAPRALSLAADDAGNAVLAWVEGFSAPFARVAARRFDAGEGWGEVTVLHEATAYADYSAPALAVDGAGNVIAAFAVAETRDGYEVHAARLAAR